MKYLKAWIMGHQGWSIILGTLAAALAAVFIVGAATSGPTGDSAVAAIKESKVTSSPSPSPTATEFVINMPRRDGNRLNADGFPEEIRGDGEKVRQFVAEQAKRDPLTLFAYYMASPLGKTAPLENESVLAKDGRIENGNTFSDAGIKAYKRWAAIWNNPDITSVKAVKEIKFQAGNTGVDGTSVTQSEGVYGDDKSGVDVEYRDATGDVIQAHSALNRCTQPTVGTKLPGIPGGPTDNPPPTTLEAKKPSQDVGANPKVDPWKQDATGGDPNKGHQVSDGNGAQVSNGYQADPGADAAAAKAAADAAAAQAAAEHQAAVDAAAETQRQAAAQAAADAAAAKAANDAAAAAKAAADAEAARKAAEEAANQNHGPASPPPSGW